MNDWNTAERCAWHFVWFNRRSTLTKQRLTFFYWKDNQSILFDLFKFALLNCFRISSIFYVALIFWLWCHLSTSSRDYVDVSFNTLFRSVFIWHWRFFCKLSIVACSQFCFFKTISFEAFHIIAVCVRSTLWLRVDVVFYALRWVYSWFDCRNLQSTYNVRALSIDFWRRFANEINENEWTEHAFLFSKSLAMWLESLLRRCQSDFLHLYKLSRRDADAVRSFVRRVSNRLTVE